ncbi:MAG: N-acetylmuramoyl-L-alanine amidase family protein [Eubacteriales bacterium]|nr:N-acetylmuramoyl-L-alanine amidase family protein [Eubacteriales bacterium]
MKKFSIITILAILITGLLSVTAYSSTVTRSIPSAKITVKASGIDFSSQVDDAMSYITVPDNSYYELDDAMWLDDVSTIKPGSAPRVKVVLEAIPKEQSHTNYDVIYLFRGSYTSSNVSITKGTFESAEVKDSGYFLEVVLKMNSISGTFDPVQTADWTEPRGTATWTANDIDSGFHEIVCYRGSTTVKHLKNYTGTSYNFFPYMTKEGSYKYKIRTTSDPGIGVGKSSEWTESGELYIEASQVSDGSGQTTADENGGGSIASNAPQGLSGNTYPNGTGNAVVVGWVQENGYTYFVNPDGTFAKNGWMKFEGNWYMFDEFGHRLTGWQKNKYGKWFYMDKTTGIMKTGWLKDNGYWYFLDTTEGDRQGRMITGWLTWNGKKYYFNESGIMVTGWYKVDGSYRYFYPEGSTNGSYGYMAVNTTVGDFKFDENGVWQ